jgi:hypothetical protein
MTYAVVFGLFIGEKRLKMMKGRRVVVMVDGGGGGD